MRERRIKPVMHVKITFLGAGSVVFLRNVIDDCLLTDGLKDAHYALYDIDCQRLSDALSMVNALNMSINDGKATFSAHCGGAHLAEALHGADFVVNAIQVGGYEPATKADFDICNKYHLQTTIGDTLGPAGIFRALRTIPILDFFAETMSRECPQAWFLNYTNPMGILSGYMQRYTDIKTVGLCHSVQVTAKKLMDGVGFVAKGHVAYRIAGINHMAWLLAITEDGRDIYPEIKRLSLDHVPENDRVRIAVMNKFGYYVTESSEHVAEYLPYFIKKTYPDQIEKYNIPLDEYPRRCIMNIEKWSQMRRELVENDNPSHERSREYASLIMRGIVLDSPFVFNGNVINNGSISNLPDNACVEVPCVTSSFGIDRIMVGALPEQCAALNRTNINVQLMAIQAAATKRKEDVYQAALLDPHASAELSMEDIKALCDDMFVAHEQWLPEYK